MRTGSPGTAGLRRSFNPPSPCIIASRRGRDRSKISDAPPSPHVRGFHARNRSGRPRNSSLLLYALRAVYFAFLLCDHVHAIPRRGARAPSMLVSLIQATAVASAYERHPRKLLFLNSLIPFDLNTLLSYYITCGTAKKTILTLNAVTPFIIHARFYAPHNVYKLHSALINSLASRNNE